MKTYSLFLVSVGTLALFLLLGAPAHAESSEPARVVRGKAQSSFARRYEAAMKLYEQGHLSEAIDEFQAAFELEQKPRLLYNMARAHFRLGHAEETLSLQQKFLQLEPNPPAEIKQQAEEDIVKSRGMIRIAEQLRVDATERKKEQAASNQPGLVSADPQPHSDRVAGPTPLYKRWWLWTAVGGGLAVVAGVVGGAVAYRQAHPSLPEPVYDPTF